MTCLFIGDEVPCKNLKGLIFCSMFLCNSVHDHVLYATLSCEAMVLQCSDATLLSIMWLVSIPTKLVNMKEKFFLVICKPHYKRLRVFSHKS
jgi:hypothetical protein